MENQSNQQGEEKSKQDSSVKKTTEEIYKEAGIPFEDDTHKVVGQTLMLFFSSPTKGQRPEKQENSGELESDEAETYLRNLNRRKPKDESK